MLRLSESTFSEGITLPDIDHVSVKIQLDSTSFVTLELWDTGGMEKFKTITNQYFRGARAVVLCVDLTSRSSWNSVKLWVNDVSRKTDVQDAALFVVATKLDLESSFVVPLTDLENCCKELGEQLYPTSAKSGNGVSELLRAVGSTLKGRD